MGTALGVVAGALMIFSAVAMWDSMQVNFATYNAILDYDLRVDMSSFQSDTALEQRVQEIAAAETGAAVDVQAALMGPVTIERPDGEIFDTVAIAMDERDPFFDLETLEGEEAFSNTDGVWIGHNVQRVLGVDVGDTVVLVLPAFNARYETTIQGIVHYTVGSPVLVPRSLVMEWSGTGVFVANTTLVRVQDGDPDDVRDAMLGLSGMYAVESVSDAKADLDYYLQYFRVGIIVFGSFGFILTLAVLFNTVDGSLRERRQELAVLRALGSRPSEIALVVTLELLLMVAIGALIGIPIGREAGYYLNGAYALDYFGQVNVMRPLSYVLGVLSMLIVVLLAEIPGLRTVQRVDLGHVSKSQSF
ncbi:MAG: FtsX-like permease family protein [Chloroflexi bacterium]|nr:FtsX-like permease family protein [Chloroflexota bacterium]